MSEDFFGDLGKSIFKTTQNAVDRTSNFFESTKINAQISAEQKEIEKLYSAIGEYVTRKYEAKDEIFPDDELRSRIEAVHARLGKLLELKQALAGAKGMKICTSCQELIANDMAFCPKCGAPVPVEEEEDLSDYEQLPPVEAAPEVPKIEELPDDDISVIDDLDDLTDAELSAVEEIDDLAHVEISDAGFTTLDDVESSNAAAENGTNE
ncbi:MAG: hypothetical protein J6D14_06655 [Lachnospiraceae bacterium]|jgi:hypothetical protein|nr:hypothetical protein [Lachnospiraceae bacterium]